MLYSRSLLVIYFKYICVITTFQIATLGRGSKGLASLLLKLLQQ